MSDPGDTLIQFDEYQFTLGEAAYVSGVSEKNIRNWMSREVLTVGRKHFLGRWLFNFYDLVRLTVMNDLTRQVAMPPAEAAQIANAQGIQDAVLAMTTRDMLGRPAAAADGVRPNVNMLTVLKNGEPVGFSVDIKLGLGRYYPPTRKEASSDENLALFRRAHVTIPIYATVGDLMERIVQLIADRQNNTDGDD